jgi:hypothetical protein
MIPTIRVRCLRISLYRQGRGNTAVISFGQDKTDFERAFRPLGTIHNFSEQFFRQANKGTVRAEHTSSGSLA